MQKRVVVLSGKIASGKSSIARLVAARFGYQLLSTRTLLERVAVAEGVADDRKSLQELGRRLDDQTLGTWVCAELQRFISEQGNASGILVDSLRIAPQIDAIRSYLKNDVTHIHIVAPEPVRRARFIKRAADGGEIDPEATYFMAQADPTEARVDELIDLADAVINTHFSTAEDEAVRVAACLGFQSRPDMRLVDVIVGGQFGSEGKGQLAAYLGPEYGALVRVGGPNAGHKVYEEPEPYTYHHLPSATRCTKAKVLIGAGATLSPEGLLREIQDCGLTRERLTIDRQAMIIDSTDRECESELVSGIGSTGQGVGWATSRRIRDRGKAVRLAKDVPELKSYIGDTVEELEHLYRSGQRVLLEGTQGTGLSLVHGTYPFVTSRDTSVAGVLSEAGIPPTRVNRVIMVTRTFPIRVESPVDGTSGPMSKEISWDEISARSRIPVEKLLDAERTSTTNRMRRVGEFDWAQFRRACLLNAPTDIALTFVDYLDAINSDARRFEQLTSATFRFLDELERCAQAPVSLISKGFGPLHVIDRRSWRSTV